MDLRSLVGQDFIRIRLVYKKAGKSWETESKQDFDLASNNRAAH